MSFAIYIFSFITPSILKIFEKVDCYDHKLLILKSKHEYETIFFYLKYVTFFKYLNVLHMCYVQILAFHFSCILLFSLLLIFYWYYYHSIYFTLLHSLMVNFSMKTVMLSHWLSVQINWLTKVTIFKETKYIIYVIFNQIYFYNHIQNIGHTFFV